ncbi:hypothetical protein O181_046068 [Austropuccinia psidii MF-1]|uniref:DUF7872 domain-containing protein n=1 Tax=Austropuccinia psidii MF-1 TaxID=1389203 RepID=A0A9Q3DTA8_9BASI|nr:hypothetical protein [Austropuccinia psidii MF-1]
MAPCLPASNHLKNLMILSLLTLSSVLSSNTPKLSTSKALQRRSLPQKVPPPVAAPPPINKAYECQKLPINNSTWNLLKIDDTLKTLPGGQNLTILQYAQMNGGGNFICGIGEFCNAEQLCHPFKAPAWQILYAVQEYNNFMNAMVDSVNYAMSQIQAVSAAMANDLFENITDSRLVINLKWLFTDMWRGIAYGATALFIITVLSLTRLNTLLVIGEILGLTAFGAGLAAYIQGVPHTVTFEPWTKLSFYISQAQADLVNHITQSMEESLQAGLTSEKGLAKVLIGGFFFREPTSAGLMETMEKSILRIVQGRLLARMLRENNAFITLSEDECKDSGPSGARGHNDALSYCNPKDKLLFNVVRAHKKQTKNSIHGASAIINKYGFTAEFITQTSWECQKKYGTFEHDPFADPNKVNPEDLTSTDCVINLPVCDMRLDDVRNLKFGKKKTTVVACRKGAGLPI